jgi:hypothetical protein
MDDRVGDGDGADNDDDRPGPKAQAFIIVPIGTWVEI